MAGIFISYRRSDSQGEAGRLFDDLVRPFGEDTVFMDVAAIEAGRDFRKAIEEGVTKSGVLLVVMGPEWITAKDEAGTRRLDNPADFVRIETAAALRRDIPVIPVLVRNARMPSAEQLPEDLKELAYRNAIELTHARWRSDILLLIDSLHRLMGSPSQSGSVAAAMPAATLGPGAEQGSTSRIDPADQQRVSRELSLIIGPIAGIVVKRAASQCASLEELYLKAAEEIDSREEREKFLEHLGNASIRAADVAETAIPLKAKPENLEVTPVSGSNQPVNKARPAPLPPPSDHRKYALLVIGGAVILGLALIVAMRFTSSRASGASKAGQTLPPQKYVEQSAQAAKPTPTTETVAKEHKPVQSSAAQAPSANLAAPVQRVRIPADVSLGLLITKTAPVYPPLARQAHVQGMVVLDADISKDGSVEALKAISGHPLLIPAAVDAAKQWRYKPYMVDGQPAPVSTQVMVEFTLSSK